MNLMGKTSGFLVFLGLASALASSQALAQNTQTLSPISNSDISQKISDDGWLEGRTNSLAALNNQALLSMMGGVSPERNPNVQHVDSLTRYRDLLSQLIKDKKVIQKHMVAVTREIEENKAAFDKRLASLEKMLEHGDLASSQQATAALEALYTELNTKVRSSGKSLNAPEESANVFEGSLTPYTSSARGSSESGASFSPSSAAEISQLTFERAPIFTRGQSGGTIVASAARPESAENRELISEKLGLKEFQTTSDPTYISESKLSDNGKKSTVGKVDSNGFLIEQKKSDPADAFVDAFKDGAAKLSDRFSEGKVIVPNTAALASGTAPATTPSESMLAETSTGSGSGHNTASTTAPATSTVVADSPNAVVTASAPAENHVSQPMTQNQTADMPASAPAAPKEFLGPPAPVPAQAAAVKTNPIAAPQLSLNTPSLTPALGPVISNVSQNSPSLFPGGDFFGDLLGENSLFPGNFASNSVALNTAPAALSPMVLAPSCKEIFRSRVLDKLSSKIGATGAWFEKTFGSTLGASRDSLIESAWINFQARPDSSALCAGDLALTAVFPIIDSFMTAAEKFVRAEHKVNLIGGCPDLSAGGVEASKSYGKLVDLYSRMLTVSSVEQQMKLKDKNSGKDLPIVVNAGILPRTLDQSAPISTFSQQLGRCHNGGLAQIVWKQESHLREGLMNPINGTDNKCAPTFEYRMMSDAETANRHFAEYSKLLAAHSDLSDSNKAALSFSHDFTGFAKQSSDYTPLGSRVLSAAQDAAGFGTGPQPNQFYTPYMPDQIVSHADNEGCSDFNRFRRAQHAMFVQFAATPGSGLLDARSSDSANERTAQKH